MYNHWVKIDFPGIKKFLFSSDRAKEIRGASAILAHLNEEIYKNEEENLINQLKKTFSPQDIEMIYSGGGGGLFVIKNKSKPDIEK